MAHEGLRRVSPRVRRCVAVALVATLLVVSCRSNDDAPLAATGPTGESPSTDVVIAGTLGTTVEQTTTSTEAATTTLVPPPTVFSSPPPTVTAAPQAPRTIAPAPPSAPSPASAPTGRRRYISGDAPAARPGVNVYTHISPDQPNPATADARSLVYVPHEVSGTTVVIDPISLAVVDTFTTGSESQHVVPSWDMKTLYAVSGRGNRITPIDPTTGAPGDSIPVSDPYNLYFTPDGSEAIVVAEGAQRLDFRDAHTFELHDSVQTGCYGLNHLDYNQDLTYFIATCEFDGTMIKFDLAQHRIVGRLPIDMSPSGRVPRRGHAQPQDIRLSSDGSVFFVADLQSDGLYVIDGESFTQVGFIPAGVGTHSLYPSRDGTKMYVINRGTNIVGGPPRGSGSVSVLDPYTREIVGDWPIPGGGSPDMGNITADGTQLWLGGRYDREVYVFDLVNGGLVARIPVGINPHGLTVWPQPGRFSLGHTGNLR